MTYPTNPTNGQQATVNGVVYTYNSTKGVWAVTSNFTGNITVNQINASAVSSAGAVTAGSLSTTGTVAATGNISGGNLNISGNIVDTGALSLITGADGNITLAPNATTTVVVAATTGTTFLNKAVVSYDGGANLTNADSMLEILDNGATSTPSIAFHRPTLYATKITLNTDNALYFGGYSAPAGGQTIVSGGHNPGATNTYDLGNSSFRWRNIFTNDLNLNNGIGDYTIVEGEDDLFLYNNKKGKVYKFALIEVDPEQATPKIDKLNSKS